VASTFQPDTTCSRAVRSTARSERCLVNADFDLYQLGEEHRALRGAVRALAENEIAPYAAEVDEAERYPVEARDALTKARFHAVHLPEHYGGEGADAVATCIVIEEVARVCASSSLIPAVNKLGTMGLLLSGSEELKRAVLPSIAAGEAMASYALSEREAGSDAASMKTRARLDGGHWVLNGTKAWTTNAGRSTWYTVMAVTDPEKAAHGISAFVVHADDPGFLEPPAGEPALVHWLVVGMCALWGRRLPTMWLKRRIRKRQRAIDRRLPYSLDLMVACLEGGLSLDASLAKVAEQGEGPLADEIRRALQEMALGRPAEDAIRDLGVRNGAPELKRLTENVVQAERMGISIAETLRQLAHDSRIRRRQAAEEMARKAPIKMVPVLIFCVLPALGIVIMVPAVILFIRTISEATPT